MFVKLRKSTVVVIITSWILFFVAAFLAYVKLDQIRQERLTNEKIFQQTTQKNTAQNVIKETNDAVKAKKKDPDAEKKAVEDFMKTYYKLVQKNDLTNLKSMVEDTNELEKNQKAIHQYVKKYDDLTYLVKKGADDESFIVYVTYKMKIKKIATLAPGMTSYYVMKKGDTFCIYNNQKHDTDEITDAKKESQNSKEIKKLTKQINKRYELALKQDKKLKQFLYKKNAKQVEKILKEPGEHYHILPGRDSMTSPGLAQLINESSVQGISKFHFYIGDLGSEEAKPFHVSSFTQSGSLAGTIILEQIYRAYRILNHQPYHK